MSVIPSPCGDSSTRHPDFTCASRFAKAIRPLLMGVAFLCPLMSLSASADRGRVQVKEIQRARNNTTVTLKTVLTDRDETMRGGAVWAYEGSDNDTNNRIDVPEYYTELKNNGINAIRVICYNPTSWDFGNTTEKDKLLGYLRKIVNHAANNDMYVMINYHEIGQINGNACKTFWANVAPEFKDRTHVFYEIMNEPNFEIFRYDSALVTLIKEVHHQVRQAAPNTHIVLCSFANTYNDQTPAAPLPQGRTMKKVADDLNALGGFDWSKASVGFHPYYNNSSSDHMVDLMQSYPGINTEQNFPEGVIPNETSQSMDGETYNIQTMERLGVSWFHWQIEASKFTPNYKNNLVTDAKNKSYLWFHEFDGSISKIATGYGGAPLGERITLVASTNNKYVSANNSGNDPLIANATTAGTAQQFDVVDAGEGYIGLKAVSNNKYVQARNYGTESLLANSTGLSSWEKFAWVRKGNNEIALRACVNGKFVRAENAGANPLIANSTQALIWEAFRPSSGAAPGSNVVSNPGFEAEQYNTQTPSGWSEWSSVGGNSSSYTEGPASQSKSGNYHGTHYNANAYNMYTFQTKTGLSNGVYTLRAWVRSSGGQTTAQLEIKDFGAGVTRAISVPNVGSYQQIQIKDIKVTNNQCTLGFWTNSSGGKWLHFDDVEFFKQ